MTTEGSVTTVDFRLLIVTNAVAAEVSSLPLSVRLLIEAASSRFVVSPLLTSPLEWLESDIDRATVGARERLEAVLGHFASGSAPIDGALGNDTFLSAIDDAVHDFAPDHLLIGLRARGHDSLQERRFLKSVRRRFSIPLTVFEVDERGGGYAATA
jgi:hypothetical protein